MNIRDEKETRKLDFFSKHMQELEDNLPLDKKYRNPKVGALAPMVVVNQAKAEVEEAFLKIGPMGDAPNRSVDVDSQAFCSGVLAGKRVALQADGPALAEPARAINTDT